MLTNLTRPLMFLDIETTTNAVAEARIVQLCLKIYSPHRPSVISYNTYINPGVEITKEATAVHGITNEEVALFPTFSHYASEVFETIKGCDIATYSGNTFDIPVLYNEFARSGIDWDYSDVHFIDVCNIFKINERRDLANAFKFYTGMALVGSHNAKNDVDATIEVFIRQMEKYGLPWDMEQLALYSNYGQKRADLTGKFIIDANGDYIINFGQKYRGHRAIDCKPFLEWMLRENFPEDAKRICRQILQLQTI